MKLGLSLPVMLMAVLASGAQAADEVLVIDQDYNIVEQGKDGPEAKDIRQRLYITKDFICIDEFGGKSGENKITESIQVDLKNRVIYNLNHIDKKKVTETFEARRKRIEERKKKAEDDLANQPPGPTRDKMEKLFRPLLDDKRKFAIQAGVSKKTIGGVECSEIKITGEDVPDYVPFDIFVHPTLELSYDNSEVLYLLQIIGRRMSDFLREHRDKFRNVPMELHLDLAAGGRLDTQVVSAKRVPLKDLDLSSRSNLGSPFEVLPYEERQRRPQPAAPVAQPGGKERPD